MRFTITIPGARVAEVRDALLAVWPKPEDSELTDLEHLSAKIGDLVDSQVHRGKVALVQIALPTPEKIVDAAGT